MTQCTVYKLEDVLEDIQSFQPEATTTTAQLRAGLKANIANMLKRASGVIPIIDLTFGPNISPCVNAGKSASSCRTVAVLTKYYWQ